MDLGPPSLCWRARTGWDFGCKSLWFFPFSLEGVKPFSKKKTKKEKISWISSNNHPKAVDLQGNGVSALKSQEDKGKSPFNTNRSYGSMILPCSLF